MRGIQDLVKENRELKRAIRARDRDATQIANYHVLASNRALKLRDALYPAYVLWREKNPGKDDPAPTVLVKWLISRAK